MVEHFPGFSPQLQEKGKKGGREGSQLPKVCHELARQNILEHKKSNDRRSEVRLVGAKKNIIKTLPIKKENGGVGEMAQ